MKDIQLWTALITPLWENGEVNYEELNKLIRIQGEAGNGVLILGSTGEGLAFSDKEKTEILEFVSALDTSAPVMMGVGGYNLDQQLNWIRQCNRASVDALLIVTPLYAKPGYRGQLHWFKTLLDAAEVPCMLYNVPGRTAVKLVPDVLSELRDHPRFWAVKEASGDIMEYIGYREAAPDKAFFSGDDALTAFFARAGCSGLVSVASNVWPSATNLYVKHCLEGKTDTLFPVWNHAVDALFSVSSPVPAKRLLKEKKVIRSAALRSPLHEEELTDVSGLIEADKKIIEWFDANK